MTVDLTVPKRWIEGHLSDLDNREAGADFAARTAQIDADRRPHLEELAEIRATKRAWLEVLHRVNLEPTHHRTREHR